MTKIDLSKEELSEREWVYKGRVELRSGKLGSTWLDHSGAEHLYDAIKHGVVGGRYLIPCTEDGTKARFAKFPRYLGTIGDQDKLQAWYAADLAAYTSAEAIKLESKDKARNALADMTLQQLREMMHTALPGRRRVLMVVIQDYLLYS